MQKKYCPKLVKNMLIFLMIALPGFLLFAPQESFALSTDTINLQGKIVRNDSGYEGLNVSTGSPTCVVDGSGNDTCDFRVRYYSASSGGTLFLTEEFSNKEIGQYNGAFNLSLGSDGSPTAGSYASLDALVLAEDTVYVEIGFDPAGSDSYSEVFSRMLLQATAFAMRSKYSSYASTAFQFDTAADSSGYSSPSAGMVYWDTTDTTLKVYDGASWVDVGSGGVGGSLWTDATTYTYLTDTADHFVLGSDSYTAIGSDNYATYVAGLDSRTPLSFDMTAERLTLSGDSVRTGLTVYSNYTTTGSWPLVLFKAEDSDFDNLVLELVQDGTGNLMSMKKGSTEVFAFENAMTFFVRPRDDAPSTYENRLYNVNGTLYWNGTALATGSSSLWTDTGAYTYLTDDDDDVIIGGSSSLDAVFYFDVANGRLGIGTGSPSSSLDIAGASSIISNSTGDIVISPEESVVIKAQNTDANNLMEWQNSSATVLSLINQSGYATFGDSTGSTTAILSLGANTTGVAQMNLASSTGTDVSSPNSGDLWWNGTNLFFFDGSDSVDLLSEGSSGLFSDHGSVSNGGYIQIAHNEDTYAILADGWVCVGGSNDESCSGGNWKNIKDTDTTIGHYLSNVWNTADPDGVIRTQTRLTDVELAPSINVGTGADGAITISGNTSINTTNSISARSCADGGDAVNYNVTALTSTSATLESAPSSGCLAVGDEVLLINLRGTNSAFSNVGNYETLRISSINSSTINFTTAKTKYYGDNVTDDTNIGVGTTAQIVMLQRVPNYTNVTIDSSYNFYPDDWVQPDGTVHNGKGEGGVMFFRATGAIAINGTIHANYKGFLGGDTGAVIGGHGAGEGGEAFCGAGGQPTGGDGATGAGSYLAAGGDGYCGGGGGGNPGGDGSDGQGGAGGGGGGYGGGGAGGGYGTGGYTGGGGSQAGTNSSNDGDSSTTSPDGGGGGAFGDVGLTDLFFGTGGGKGGYNGGYAGGGNGGDGGGIIYIAGNSITVSGALQSNGGDGQNYTSYNTGGGGGSGGSIKLIGNTVNVGSSKTYASGGAGGAGYGGGATYHNGGAGGTGRIAIEYASSISGTSSPSASSTEVGYYNYGIYNSPVIATPDAQSYGNIRWAQTLDTYGNVSVQTRSGDTNDSTDGSWEEWRPFEATDNYITLESADTHTTWSGTNATVAEGDVTRDVDFFEDEDEGTATNVTKITSSTNGGYAEATISSTDISGYDYITFWIRASQTGNTLQIGFGESAGDEQEEYITIDASDTWQKVYWDISDIDSGDKDGVTKLRLTNFSTDSNTIYLDNVRAETLLTNNDSSPVTSTPDNYFQYRVIFTTTDLSYYPRLENIQFTYNTGYGIVIYDENNVRLYNYSGSTQYLKLDVGTVSSGGVMGSFINFAPASAQVDITDSLSTMWINKTGTGGNFLRFQDSGSDVFIVNDSGGLVTSGDIEVSGGDVNLGSDGWIRFNEVSGELEFSNDDGTSWIALGPLFTAIILSAEYPGAVLSADGGDNTGSMTSDSDASSNSMNYYEWSSSETSLNDYDVRVRFMLPSDFDSWGAGGVVFNFATEATGTTNNKLDFYIYEESSVSVDGSSEGNASSSAGVWTSATIAGSGLSDCVTAEDVCMLVVKMSSANDSYSRVGDIEIGYDRKL